MRRSRLRSNVKQPRWLNINKPFLPERSTSTSTSTPRLLRLRSTSTLRRSLRRLDISSAPTRLVTIVWRNILENPQATDSRTLLISTDVDVDVDDVDVDVDVDVVVPGRLLNNNGASWSVARF